MRQLVKVCINGDNFKKAKDIREANFWTLISDSKIITASAPPENL